LGPIIALAAPTQGAAARAAQDVAAQAQPGAASGAAELPGQETSARPNINPYNRDIAMTVPLQFNRRVLGEMPVLLTADDRFIVNTAGFVSLIAPLLTEEAQAELAASLAGIAQFAPEEINAAGIQLDYDPDQLAVLVLRIDPSKRTPEFLFRGGKAEPAEQGPEDFSAYLNSNISVSRRMSTGDVDKPSVFLNGAVRFAGFVLEADVQGREDQFSDTYNVERRYARLVYDEPEDFRRWTFGDLDPEVRGRQGFTELGGLGVNRQRRRFESFRNNVLSGSRQLILQEPSVVRVSRNGVFVREFRLDPGQYDVSNLPLDAGGNDVQIDIEGESGRRDSVSYSAYLDSIDLEPGDYEYGAYFGVTSDGLFGQPDYSDGELAFTGYYRKAFENRPSIGAGLQASQDVQTLTGQSQLILPGGARLQFDGSFSNSEFAAQGYAFAVGYEYLLDLGGTADAVSFVADFISDDFATLGNRFGDNPTSWSFSAGYSRRFSTDWIGNLSASYRMSRDPSREDAYTINASSTYRVTPEWSVQVGVEYSDFGIRTGPAGFSDAGFGATAALIWTPNFRDRGEARYNSARDSGSIRFQRAGENRVDAFGYSVASTYDDGAGSISGQVDYSSNRFDATVSHIAFGRDLSNITEEQVTSVRVGSSIATTGGRVAIGRTIYDSFAIVYPHESLRGHDVIVGESLEGGRFTSRSGAFGPALSNLLTSYVNQSVRYDAIEAPRGYDIGDGILRVHPAYRSGYAIEVGSSAFVSALGRLVGNGAKPVALMSGRMVPIDSPDAEPQLFFTNSVGRFALQSLEPGKHYRVELFTSPAQSFEFEVPADSDGLLDLHVVSVPVDVTEE
jgi:outer membrane usher protein